MKPATRPRPDDPAIDRLSEYLCFAIYSANLALGKAYKPILEELGLTYTQYIAIIALWEEDGQTVSSLGEKLFLESNTLTPILKKLESMGYLRRQRDPSDERHVRIRLTDAGVRLRESALGMGLKQEIGLPDKEFVALQASVATMRDRLIASIKNRS